MVVFEGSPVRAASGHDAQLLGAISPYALKTAGVLLICVGGARLVSSLRRGEGSLPMAPVLVQGALLVIGGVAVLVWAYVGS